MMAIIFGTIKTYKMKNKLSNEEIARVFSMYWGAEISINTSLVKKRIINGAGFNAIGELLIITNDGNFGITHWGIKLLLTPLSKVTDEDAIAISDIWDNFFLHPDRCKVEERIHFGKHIVSSGKYLHKWEALEYLKMHHYLIPLFFGVNHWANSKTAIELGIAIEK